MPRKLTRTDKNLMKIIHRDSNESGWTWISPFVLPVVEKLPVEYVEIIVHDNVPDAGASARLTAKGENIVKLQSLIEEFTQLPHNFPEKPRYDLVRPN